MKACTKHDCGFFGSGGFIIFEIEEGQDNYEFYELLPMLLLGVSWHQASTKHTLFHMVIYWYAIYGVASARCHADCCCEFTIAMGCCGMQMCNRQTS